MLEREKRRQCTAISFHRRAEVALTAALQIPVMLHEHANQAKTRTPFH
jgi:hypothetical protein